jgi:hypothetical protein
MRRFYQALLKRRREEWGDTKEFQAWTFQDAGLVLKRRARDGRMTLTVVRLTGSSAGDLSPYVTSEEKALDAWDVLLSSEDERFNCEESFPIHISGSHIRFLRPGVVILKART